MIYKEWKNGEATWVQNGWCNIKSIPSTPSEGGGGGGGVGPGEKEHGKGLDYISKGNPPSFNKCALKSIISTFHPNNDFIHHNLD